MFNVYRSEELDEQILSRLMERGRRFSDEVVKRVREILDEVREKGDAAIAEFVSGQVGRSVSPDELVMSQEKLSRAYKSLDKKVVNSIKQMIRNVRKFHKLQLPKPFFVKIEEGVYAGQLVIPLDSAGLYVPSGKAVYPSVAVMVTVPAKVAGVGRIAVASPPWNDELTIEPATLVAAHLSGATEFYVMGGAHAIAAFAYGTERVKKVDCIAGPGGPYTYVAKMLVREEVRIDIPAGPSEALVLTDGTLPVDVVCWDFLNEAEHGPDSTSILITTSEEFAYKASKRLEELVETLPEPRRSFVKAQRDRSVIIVCKDLRSAIELANRFAPEHLLIDSRYASRIFRRYRRFFRNFGTLCLNTPFVAGNYGIGPNSTLPTGGYARLYSGLSVEHFIKRPTVEELRGREGYRRLMHTVLTMAEYEGFPAHANAFKARLTIGRGNRFAL